MTSITMILFATLLACASRTTAVTTQQLSATVGGETNITCLFGEGTLRNIYWYFNTTQRILTLAKGVLTVESPYKGRATLQNDNNTLSLKGITIADEGTYRCDVDRQGQPAVLHIYSDLNIYSLRPGTLPVVSPCAMVGEATRCTAQANDTFTIICTLFNVYPVKDAVLTWYQDGKSVSSSYGESLNNDVIANLSLRIEVTQSRNLSCNATFESADGRQHTAVSVEALVTPLAVLSPGTPPVIRQCLQEQPNSSPCTLTCEGPINLTCQLTNVYPVTDLSLGWYQDGRGPLEAAFFMSETKEDGSIDLETNVDAFETGEWLCKASYLSAYGIEQTSASISLTILETNDTGSPMDPVKIAVPIVVVLAVIVVIVIIAIVRRRRNRRLEANGQYGEIKPAEKVELGDKLYGSIDDEILANIAEEVTDESDLSKLGRHLGIRQFKLNQILKENEQAKDVFPATSMLFTWKEKTPPAKQVPKMVKALEQSDMENLITEYFPNEAGVTDKRLFELADNILDAGAIEQLGINFGFRQFKVNQYLNMNKDRGDRSGTLAMLLEWRKKTPRTAQIRDLVDALKNAGAHGSFNNN